MSRGSRRTTAAAADDLAATAKLPSRQSRILGTRGQERRAIATGHLDQKSLGALSSSRGGAGAGSAVAVPSCGAEKHLQRAPSDSARSSHRWSSTAARSSGKGRSTRCSSAPQRELPTGPPGCPDSKQVACPPGSGGDLHDVGGGTPQPSLRARASTLIARATACVPPARPSQPAAPAWRDN
jgi:hypothetical protein